MFRYRQSGRDSNFDQAFPFGKPVAHNHHDDATRHRFLMHRDHFCGHAPVFGRDMASATRRFLVPGLLLLLAEKPSHGYAILNDLADMGVLSPDTPIAIVYRALRHMETEGLTVSDQVEGPGQGPARKVYRLTEEGWEALRLWSRTLESMQTVIGDIQKRYGQLEKKREDGKGSDE